MKVLIFFVALAGSVLSLDFDYDGRYVYDNSGEYVPDDSGRYIPDNSGDYIHQPGPDGPDYQGEAASIDVSILSPNILPSDTKTYLPPPSAGPPRVRPIPPLELPLLPSGIRTPPSSTPITPLSPVNPSPIKPLLPSNPSTGPFGSSSSPVRPLLPSSPSSGPFGSSNFPIKPLLPTNPSTGPLVSSNLPVRPFVSTNPPAGSSGRPSDLPPISRGPPSRGTITIPGPPPAEISSSTKRPGIRGGGPYIWDYESIVGHTVEVIDPYHRYRVNFLPH
ncbi:hypothetical protein Trydic_g22303 [Trypoxylus dichotomus]